MKHMVEAQALDDIINRSIRDDFWNDVVQFGELRTAVEEQDSEKVVVTEGSSDRWVDLRAVNFITMAIWDPKYTFDSVRNSVTDADDLLDSFESVIVKAPSPQLRKDKFDTARTRGFVREVSKLAAILAEDEREENYTFRAYRVLVQSESKLDLGTNPLGEAKEFYGRDGPIRIVTEIEENRPTGTQSASEADW